jgi:hypothetical protein
MPPANPPNNESRHYRYSLQGTVASTHKKTQYSLKSRIYQVKLATMIHYLRYDRILPELMDKRYDFEVGDEAFGGTAAVDDCC